MTFAEDMAVREAFEAQHKCVIIRSFQKVPPQEFQNLMVREANTYYSVSEVRFIDKHLVATRVNTNSIGMESLYSMLDGLARGYKLALGPTKPYYITYTDVKLAPQYRKQYKGKTEREVYEAEGLSYYNEQLPERMFIKKEVTEWFASVPHADARINELCGLPEAQVFPLPVSENHWQIKYDAAKGCHF